MSVSVQQVNLYLPELRPRREWLTASNLLVLLAVLALVMLLAGVFSSWQRSNLQNELAAAQAALQEQSAITEQLERDVASRATDQQLLREMNTREERLRQSRELFEFMSTTTLGNLQGYSEHMKDLSRASFQGLWLTQFSIVSDASFVTLQGSAQEAAMLPDFVGRLSMGESAIRNKRFSRLTSTRSSSAAGGEVYDFVLETN
jgi:Tfp pilus assembly protein PilE